MSQIEASDRRATNNQALDNQLQACGLPVYLQWPRSRVWTSRPGKAVRVLSVNFRAVPLYLCPWEAR